LFFFCSLDFLVSSRGQPDLVADTPDADAAGAARPPDVATNDKSLQQQQQQQPVGVCAIALYDYQVRKFVLLHYNADCSDDYIMQNDETTATLAPLTLTQPTLQHLNQINVIMCHVCLVMRE
jgi:hypothetical protein